MHKSVIENKCKDCLYMDMDAVTVTNQRIELHMTMNFNYQEHRLASERFAIMFGLRGGEVRLHLRSADIQEFFCRGTFAWEIEKVTRHISQNAISKGHSWGLKGHQSLSGGEVGLQANKSTNVSDERRIEDEARYQAWQVTALYDPPGWRFCLKSNEQFFTGGLKGEKIAMVSLRGDGDCALEARFTTEQRYVYVEITEGLFVPLKEIDIRKRKVISLFLWHKVIKPLVYPFLSKVVLTT